MSDQSGPFTVQEVDFISYGGQEYGYRVISDTRTILVRRDLPREKLIEAGFFAGEMFSRCPLVPLTLGDDPWPGDRGS